MSIKNVHEIENNINQLIDEVANIHQPITILGKNHNAVLISEEDWSAIQETLFLLSIPGMRESIKQGLATPIAECEEDLDW
jgi:antitoxin YefM